MSPLSLDLEPPEVPVEPCDPSESEAPTLTFPYVEGGLLPGRGLLYSLLAHEVVFFLIIFLSLIAIHHKQMIPPSRQWELTMMPKEAIYLPQLGGGHEGSGGRGGESSARPQKVQTPAIPAPSPGGVSYPGSQAIVSNPPHPTNRIQTILQPSLPHPRALATFLPLPDVVKLAQSAPPAQAPHAASSSRSTVNSALARARLNFANRVKPLIESSPLPTLEKPKLALPAAPVEELLTPKKVLAEKPPEPGPVPGRNEVKPEQAATSSTPASGKNSRTILTLSAIPSPATRLQIPPVEARGQFVVTPNPQLALAHAGPAGSGKASTPTARVGVGSSPVTNGADATSAHGGATGPHGNSPGSPGKTGEAGSGGTGTDATGAGNSVGSGHGHGPGNGSGSGTGAGAGPGNGAFAGITIQGGSWGPDGSSSSALPRAPYHVAEVPLQPQGSYGLTIVSTGNNGGGLPDFGIFRNEAVFTVYIDMRQSVADPAPSWTLQYALLNPSSPVAEQVLVPPFPNHKERPRFDPEMLLRSAGQWAVVYAILDREGKLQEIRVLQSPNAQFASTLTEALAKWVFRPARLNGEPVAVKTLIGFPIPAR